MAALTGGLLAAAMVAAVAAGQSPIVAGYGGQAGASQSEVQPGQADVLGGFLPFSGLELTVILAGALILLATGIGLRRLARQKS